MPQQRHPDKKTVYYGEWAPVVKELEAEAKARNTARGRDPGAPKVTVTEIIREQTLLLANKLRRAQGKKPLDLDTSSSPTKTRGMRVRDSKSLKMVA